jgi:hypothetical protein
MSIISWPSSLPQKVLLDNSLQYLSGLDNPEGRNDNAQNRERTNAEKELVCYINCTLAQWIVFKTFYKTTLNDGGGVFIADWLETFELDHHSVRFLVPPVMMKQGVDIFRVQLHLEVTTLADANGVWVFP